jgi:hypothetical protein
VFHSHQLPVGHRPEAENNLEYNCLTLSISSWDLPPGWPAVLQILLKTQLA